MHFLLFFPAAYEKHCESWRRRPGRRSSNEAFRCNLLRKYKFCNLARFCELCLEISSVNAFLLVFPLQHMGN